MVHGVPDPTGATARVEDCWNRIGTRGDRSCPRLAEYSRCMNCPVFEQAAALLLDRPLSEADMLAAAEAARAQPTNVTAGASRDGSVGATPAATNHADASLNHSALVFRIADEWLALPSEALRHVDNVRPIHSLPHRRNRVVLGLVNVRGALTVAASLGELLNLGRSNGDRHASRSGYARMLVAAHRGEPVALPVDEVEGVLRFATSALMPVPATLAHATAVHARGVLAWRDTTVGLLDTDRLFDSLARSLR
jgi:chemotaxis-related protein WspD